MNTHTPNYGQSVKARLLNLAKHYLLHQSPDATLHVSDSRHVGYDIILLVPTERVLKILKFLPFTASILLGYSHRRCFCSSSSSICYRFKKLFRLIVEIPKTFDFSCNPLSEVSIIGFSSLYFNATERIILSGVRLSKSSGRSETSANS